jgi:pimeloyl-[acyl-carrier protein] methyl ester esterase
MDGTGTLFSGFVRALGPDVRAHVVAYPGDRVLGYDELEALVRSRLSGEGPTVLVAESFSGPIAMRLAAAPDATIRGVVLVATFARPPAPRILSLLTTLGVFHMEPPRFALRALLLGRDAPAELVDELRAAIASVAPKVLAHRLRRILTESSGVALGKIRVPVMLVLPEHDRLVRSYQGIIEEARDARVEWVAGPHLVLQRCPEVCARLVTDFVESLRAP